MTEVQLDQRARAGGPDASTGPPPPAPVPRALAAETGYLLRRAYVFAGDWAAAAMPDGVPIRHYQVLQALADLGSRSQHELSELLWVNRTITVKLIDALEHGGLVVRRRNPADRRSYALELTRAGERARSELTVAADRIETGLTGPLTARERTSLRTGLSAIALATEKPMELPAGLAGRIGFLLTPAHQRVRQAVNEHLHALGLTTALYGVLATIAASGPTSQQQIAEQLGLTGPAILQTVDRLEAGGHVDRRRDPNDRRSYALEPSRRGHDTLRQARAAIAEVNRGLDDVLGGERQRRLLNRLLLRTLRQD